MPAFTQQLFIIFCCISTVCLGQVRDISNVFFEPHYREVSLTAIQSEAIFHADDSLKKIGLPTFKIYTTLNAFIYSILSKGQKAQYDSIYQDYWFRIHKNIYDYLNLSDEQVMKLVKIQSGLLTSDSLRSASEYNLIIRRTIYNLLDTSQINLYVEREKLNDQNQRKLRAQGDEENKKNADFQIKRLGLVKKYHQKFLSKSKARVLKEIRLVNNADALKLKEIENKYQARTHIVEKIELMYCYSEDSVLLAPLTAEYIKAKYEIRRYQPSLCMYWCAMGGETVDFIEEEEWMYQQLEYFKSTYPSSIEKELSFLVKKKDKLNKAIDKFRPEKYKGTIVTLVAEERVQALEEVAELLLTR